MPKSVLGLMFTRYFRLLPVGAVLGAGASMVCFAWVNANHGLYTASVPFLVVPPMPPIGGTAETEMLSPEEVERVIHRQVFFLQTEGLLQNILNSQEFHPGGKPSDWLARNGSHPISALRRDLQVVSHFDGGAFEIQMTAHNPMDALTLVQAAVNVYLDKLQSDSRARHVAFARRLEDAVKTGQDSFQIKSDALVDYGRRKGIDVQKSRFEIEKSSLTKLNDEWTRNDAAASGAEQQYEAIKKAKAEGKVIELSADLQASIENDATLRLLQAAKLNWEQESAAQSATTRPVEPAKLDEISARLNKIDQQILETRKFLQDSARDRMEKMLKDSSVEKRFLADYVNDLRKKKEEIVTGIGQDLLVWQQRVDDLKELGDLQSKIKAQLGLVQANQATDDTMVAQLGDAVLPKETSWPHWWTFLPAGTAAGLLVSMGFAARLSAHYRRTLNAPPPLPADADSPQPPSMPPS